jgi:hypothetical protein
MPMKPDQSQSSLKISRHTLTLTRTLIISHCKSFWGRRKLATLKVQNIKKTPQMFCFFKILYRGPFWEFKWQMVNSNHIFLRVVITSPWPLNVFSSISLCWLLLLNFFSRGLGVVVDVVPEFTIANKHVLSHTQLLLLGRIEFVGSLPSHDSKHRVPTQATAGARTLINWINH